MRKLTVAKVANVCKLPAHYGAGELPVLPLTAHLPGRSAAADSAGTLQGHTCINRRKGVGGDGSLFVIHENLLGAAVARHAYLAGDREDYFWWSTSAAVFRRRRRALTAAPTCCANRAPAAPGVLPAGNLRGRSPVPLGTARPQCRSQPAPASQRPAGSAPPAARYSRPFSLPRQPAARRTGSAGIPPSSGSPRSRYWWPDAALRWVPIQRSKSSTTRPPGYRRRWQSRGTVLIPAFAGQLQSGSRRKGSAHKPWHTPRCSCAPCGARPAASWRMGQGRWRVVRVVEASNSV